MEPEALDDDEALDRDDDVVERQRKRAREPPPDAGPRRCRSIFSTIHEYQQYMVERRRQKERLREFHRLPRQRQRDQSMRSRPSRERQQAERRRPTTAG